MTAGLDPNSPELQAEQALLGALLLDATALAPLAAWLHPAHLYRHAHRELYQLLLARRRAGHPATGPDADPDARRDWALGTLDQARSVSGFTPGYGHTLIAACPSAGHAHAYAVLVLEAAVRRELAKHAHRLGSVAATGHHADVVLLVPALERTLARCSAVWTTATAGHQGPACADPPSPVIPRTAPAGARELADEETLIAVLMARPQALAPLAGQLRPGDFAGPLQRLVYEAMVDLSERAEPVDPLTVLWRVRATAPTRPALDLDQVRHVAGREQPGDPGYWAERVILASALRTTLACAEQLRSLAADPRRPVDAVLADARQLLPPLHEATGRVRTDGTAPPAGPAATGTARTTAASRTGPEHRSAFVLQTADPRRAPPPGAEESAHPASPTHARPAQSPATGRRHR